MLIDSETAVFFDQLEKLSHVKILAMSNTCAKPSDYTALPEALDFSGDPATKKFVYQSVILRIQGQCTSTRPDRVGKK